MASWKTDLALFIVSCTNDMPSLAYGIALGGEDNINGISCSNSVAYNNIIVSENAEHINAGLAMFGTVNCAFHNNLVIGAQSGFYSKTSNASIPNFNPVFKNNMIINTTADAYRHENGSLNGSEDFDFNLFFNTANPPTETNSIYADPEFVDITSDGIYYRLALL